MTVPFVRARGLSRRYAGVVALNGVDFEISPGEVIGLIGKNGAGKSTLIRILAGVEHQNEGDLQLFGRPVPDRYTPAVAGASGLAFMHQELANVPELTVAENVALGSRFPRRFGALVDWEALRRKVRTILSKLELEADPDALVGDLTVVGQRMVMIARALYHDAKVIVLDEPSTSLTGTEIEHLHRVIRTLRSEGRSVVYVSHRLNEIVEITDRIVVMTDGRVTLERTTAGITQQDLVEAIAGGVLKRSPARRAGVLAGPAILRVRNLTATPDAEGVSFDLHAGEILGIAGLVGSGRTELVRMIFGADTRQGGTIEIDGKAGRWTSPRGAVSAGIALLPEDRRFQGLVLGMSVRENITLASLGRHRRRGTGIIDTFSERTVAEQLVKRLSVKTPGVEQEVRRLSGGNQQKVVLAKWLARQGRVLIFDEPTQGVDVHAKEEIFQLVRDNVADGRGAIVISSDFSELVSLADRVITLRDGRLTGSLSGAEINEAQIVRLAYAH